MEHLTELSQSLCDAAKDLDPQSLVGKIAEDLLECDHLVILADMPVTRECASTAKDRLNAEPHELVNLVVAHHKKDHPLPSHTQFDF